MEQSKRIADSKRVPGTCESFPKTVENLSEIERLKKEGVLIEGNVTESEIPPVKVIWCDGKN